MQLVEHLDMVPDLDLELAVQSIRGVASRTPGRPMAVEPAVDSGFLVDRSPPAANAAHSNLPLAKT